MTGLDPITVSRNGRRLAKWAVIAACSALGAELLGGTRLAIAALVAALLLTILALEALRVVATSRKGPGR